MKLSRFATFGATFVLCSAALAALPVPNPSMGDLSGAFRIGLAQRQLDPAQQAALDAADGVMERDYKKLSKALKKSAGAIAKLDGAFGEDEGYNDDADFLVSFLSTTTNTQLGLSAQLALADDVIANPRAALRIAKLMEKNTRTMGTIDLTNATSKISRAKNRSKQFKVMAGAAKKFEKTIKRYGKNNQAF